jgi:hypothetical protein
MLFDILGCGNAYFARTKLASLVKVTNHRAASICGGCPSGFN